MTSCHVEDLNPSNEKDWEDLNERSELGTFFHTLRWKRVVERSFGLRTRYFLVYDGDAPVALCPLSEWSIKGMKALTSLPYGDTNYLLISNPSDHEVARLILKKSLEIATEARLPFIILFNSNSETRDSMFENCSSLNKGVLEYPPPVVPFLDLEKHCPSDIWDNVFNSKKGQRKYIKRFEQDGYEIKASRSAADQDSFYKYYSENVNFIGGKPIERSHIDDIFDEYSDENLRMTLMRKDDEVAGGLIAFLYPPKKTMYLRHLAMNRGLPSTYHPPYALFWEAVNYAYDHGLKWVCFGSSSIASDQRSHQIKMAFGCDYLENNGVLIGRNALAMAAYKMYKWSWEARAQRSA